MTTELHAAVVALIRILDEGAFGRKAVIRDGLVVLKDAYEDHTRNLTETQARVEFLRRELETGISKREAARRLVAHDPRIGQKSAESLVYMNYSGQYQTSKRGRRLKQGESPPKVERLDPPPDITSDEDLI